MQSWVSRWKDFSVCVQLFLHSFQWDCVCSLSRFSLQTCLSAAARLMEKAEIVLRGVQEAPEPLLGC